jgi:Predicted oxidoreductases (related to aryl-alcohol dehydrogenases)
MWGGTKRNNPEGAIRAAVDHGINLIDTAPMYGYGRSEELVGDALKGLRDKVVLSTKCGMVWYKKEDDKFFDSTIPVELKTKRIRSTKFISISAPQ